MSLLFTGMETIVLCLLCVIDFVFGEAWVGRVERERSLHVTCFIVVCLILLRKR
jgi:hypothetical protein